MKKSLLIHIFPLSIQLITGFIIWWELYQILIIEEKSYLDWGKIQPCLWGEISMNIFNKDL